MDDEPLSVETPPPTLRSHWSDLIVYLIVGFGGFLAYGVGVVAVAHLADLESHNFICIIALLIGNVVCFTSTAYWLGVRRRRFTLDEIGAVPPRLPVEWLGIAVALTLGLLPIRVIISITAEYLVNGNLDSLQKRNTMLTAGGFTWTGFVLMFMFVGLLVPIAEELFFRGAIYAWFRDRCGVIASMIGSSALFGLAHYDSLAVVLASFILGLACAFVYEKSRSIWVSIALHATNNSIAVLLLYATMWLKM